MPQLLRLSSPCVPHTIGTTILHACRSIFVGMCIGYAHPFSSMLLIIRWPGHLYNSSLERIHHCWNRGTPSALSSCEEPQLTDHFLAGVSSSVLYQTRPGSEPTCDFSTRCKVIIFADGVAMVFLFSSVRCPNLDQDSRHILNIRIPRTFSEYLFTLSPPHRKVEW